MYETGVVALVGELADSDPATCDRAGLAALVAVSQRVRAWLDAFDVRVAVHASRLSEQGACEPASACCGATAGVPVVMLTERRGGPRCAPTSPTCMTPWRRGGCQPDTSTRWPASPAT